MKTKLFTIFVLLMMILSTSALAINDLSDRYGNIVKSDIKEVGADTFAIFLKTSPGGISKTNFNPGEKVYMEINIEIPYIPSGSPQVKQLKTQLYFNGVSRDSWIKNYDITTNAFGMEVSEVCNACSALVEYEFTAPLESGQWQVRYQLKDTNFRTLVSEQKNFNIADDSCPDSSCGDWNTMSLSSFGASESRSCFTYSAEPECKESVKLEYRTACTSGNVIKGTTDTEAPGIKTCVAADSEDDEEEEDDDEEEEEEGEEVTPCTEDEILICDDKEEIVVNKCAFGALVATENECKDGTPIPEAMKKQEASNFCELYESATTDGECIFDFKRTFENYQTEILIGAGVLLFALSQSNLMKKRRRR